MNTTQLVGLLSFGCAGVACASALRRTRRGAWGYIGGVQLAFLIEVLGDFRHILLGMAVGWLQSTGNYAGLKPFQRWMLVALAVITLGTALLLLKWLGGHGHRVLAAAFISAVTAALFLSEAVSLHDWDAMVYRAEGPVMLIAWGWLAAALIVGWCAVTDR